MLHPKKYESHVLEDLRKFYNGVIRYPEINLKLAGEEAWLEGVNPELADAVRTIIRTIREYLEGTPWDGTGKPIPRYIIVDIFNSIAPEIQLLKEALDKEGKYEFFNYFKKLNTSPLYTLKNNYAENESLWRQMEKDAYLYYLE